MLASPPAEPRRGGSGAFRGRFFTGPLEKRSGSVGTRAVAGMWSKKDTGYLYKALVVVLCATEPPRFPGDPTKIPTPESGSGADGWWGCVSLRLT